MGRPRCTKIESYKCAQSKRSDAVVAGAAVISLVILKTNID